ncbi:WYL domain-containing protein [Agrobacterium fabrum]
MRRSAGDIPQPVTEDRDDDDGDDDNERSQSAQEARSFLCRRALSRGTRLRLIYEQRGKRSESLRPLLFRKVDPLQLVVEQNRQRAVAMQDRQRQIVFVVVTDDNGNATPLQMGGGLPLGLVVPHRIGIGDEETAAFFCNRRQCNRNDGQRCCMPQLQANPQHTDKREQHRETAETKQGNKHAKRDDAVPEHVETERNRCELRVLRGNDQTGFVITGMEIDEHHLDVLLVADAAMIVGKLGFAGREDRLARLAAAADIAVFDF